MIDGGVLDALAAHAAHVAAGGAAGLASTLHCAGMCGPLAACASRAGGRAAVAALGYHAGRLSSYALGGALAGLLGARLGAIALPWRVGLAVLAAAFIARQAWRLASPRPLPHPTPMSLTRRRYPSLSLAAPVARHETGDGTSIGKGALGQGLGLGLVTGFLPCGALAAGLLVAAATQRAGSGVLAMVAFALASAPSLLLAQVGARALGRPPSPKLRRAAAMMLAGSALWLLVSAAAPLAAPGASCH